MKIYSVSTIVIIILIATALALGYFIFQQRTSSQKEGLPEPISSPIETPDSSTTTSIQETAEGEFTIFIGENTKIFGIAKENPYYGEPPAPGGIGGGTGGGTEAEFFEIFGIVISVDQEKGIVSISSDGIRPLNTTFTPRGPEISLQDIKEGDRIVANNEYDANGEPDFDNVDFIQITPSLEEIRLLREAQGL